MAIVREFFSRRSDGVNLYKTYSDAGMYIRKIGTEEVYQEAIDVETAPWSYEETEDKIEYSEEELKMIEERKKAEAEEAKLKETEAN